VVSLISEEVRIKVLSWKVEVIEANFIEKQSQ